MYPAAVSVAAHRTSWSLATVDNDPHLVLGDIKITPSRYIVMLRYHDILTFGVPVDLGS